MKRTLNSGAKGATAPSCAISFYSSCFRNWIDPHSLEYSRMRQENNVQAGSRFVTVSTLPLPRSVSRSVRCRTRVWYVHDLAVTRDSASTRNCRMIELERCVLRKIEPYVPVATRVSGVNERE